MGRLNGSGHHGSITQLAPNRWRIRVTRGLKRIKRVDGTPTGSDGKQRQHNEVFVGTRSQAVARADQIWDEMGEDSNLGDRLTLSEYWLRVYTPEHLARRRGDTQRGYESAWKTYIEPAFGDSWPPDISHRDLQMWVDGIESAANQRKMVRILRALLRKMQSDLRITEPIGAITDKIEYKPLQRHRKEIWGADEVLEAMRRLKGVPIERLFLVMAGGGLRREEALPLVCPDDFWFRSRANGMVCRVDVTKTFTAGGGVEDLTKTYKDRTVTIGEPFASRLAELMPPDYRPEPLFPSSQPTRRRVAKDDTGVDPRLIEGTPIPSMTPSGTASAWRKLFRESREYTRPPYVRDGTHVISGFSGVTKAGPLVGMRFINLESLRNTHVTLAHMGGASMEMSALAHGHSQKVAFEHYLGTEGAADAVADAVSQHMTAALASDSANDNVQQIDDK